MTALLLDVAYALAIWALLGIVVLALFSAVLRTWGHGEGER